MSGTALLANTLKVNLARLRKGKQLFMATQRYLHRFADIRVFRYLSPEGFSDSFRNQLFCAVWKTCNIWDYLYFLLTFLSDFEQ